MDIKLKTRQGLVAGVIFLNILGLTVENENCGTVEEAYAIYKNETCVGYMTCDGKDVLIQTNSPEYSLKAKYHLPKAFCMKDYESGMSGYVFSQFVTKIKFMIDTKEQTKIAGKLGLSCSIDLEMGNTCLMYCTVKAAGQNFSPFKMRINNKGVILGLEECIDNEHAEAVKFSPAYSFEPTYIYEKYDTKTQDGNWKNRDLKWVSTPPQRDSLNVRRWDGGDFATFYKNIPYKKTDDSDIQTYIDICHTMKEYFPEVFDIINSKREYLKVGEISLLDRFLKASANRWTEVYDAIVGYPLPNIEWQNGAKNLKEAYFSVYKQQSQLEEPQQVIKGDDFAK